MLNTELSRWDDTKTLEENKPRHTVVHEHMAENGV